MVGLKKLEVRNGECVKCHVCERDIIGEVAYVIVDDAIESFVEVYCRQCLSVRNAVIEKEEGKEEKELSVRSKGRDDQ